MPGFLRSVLAYSVATAVAAGMAAFPTSATAVTRSRSRDMPASTAIRSSAASVSSASVGSAASPSIAAASSIAAAV